MWDIFTYLSIINYWVKLLFILTIILTSNWMTQLVKLIDEVTLDIQINIYVIINMV
jgi:hypothetical protein